MNKNKSMVLILTCLLALVISQGVLAADKNINKNENNINVNVNVNKDDASENNLKEKKGELTDIGNNTVFSPIGLTTPIFGGTTDKYIDGKKYTTSMSGINGGLGYTKRNYFGKGLPVKGGAGYFEYGTVGLIMPMIGVGYTYRINKSFFVSAGIPDFAIGFTF